MQFNEVKIGLLRRRYKITGTLMGADVSGVARELAAFTDELRLSLEHHGHLITDVELCIASGLQSIRAIRPEIRQLLENDPSLKSAAQRCRVAACFLTRMGDREGHFGIRGD